MSAPKRRQQLWRAALIVKVPHGFRVDGLDLVQSSCGCGGLTGMGGAPVSDCCFTYSTVTLENHTVAFFAKATSPATTDNYEWGYRVRKGPVEVDVLVHDTRAPRDFPFGGVYPPPVSEWVRQGWQVLSRFERPLQGIGGRLPVWCRSPEACECPASGCRATHLEPHRKELH